MSEIKISRGEADVLRVLVEEHSRGKEEVSNNDLGEKLQEKYGWLEKTFAVDLPNAVGSLEKKQLILAREVPDNMRHKGEPKKYFKINGIKANKALYNFDRVKETSDEVLSPSPGRVIPQKQNFYRDRQQVAEL